VPRLVVAVLMYVSICLMWPTPERIRAGIGRRGCRRPFGCFGAEILSSVWRPREIKSCESLLRQSRCRPHCFAAVIPTRRNPLNRTHLQKTGAGRAEKWQPATEDDGRAAGAPVRAKAGFSDAPALSAARHLRYQPVRSAGGPDPGRLDWAGAAEPSKRRQIMSRVADPWKRAWCRASSPFSHG
jgi:hypothetical protein